MHPILVVFPANDAQKARILEAAGDNSVLFEAPERLSDAALARVEIIFGNLPAHLLPRAEALKWLQLNSAGADAYTAPGLLRPDTLLTSAVGAYGLTVSEHMLAMLMGVNRHLMEFHAQQQQRLWRPFGRMRSIEGSTILTIGLGNIGGDFARKVKALGAYTLGIRRNIGDCPDYVDEMHPMSALDQLLPRADVVAIAAPLTAETRGLFDRARLERMKDDAVLINIGRGPIVDTEALTALVQAGKFSGVCLDVTDPEPLPKEHPLWQMERVMITPHVAGHFFLPETKNRITAIFCDNLRRYCQGQPLRNLVARD